MLKTVYQMIDHFNLLSPEEVEKFGKFLNSPYFNSNKKLRTFFKYLRTKYPHVNKSVLSKKAVYRSAYRNETYNDTKLRKLMSDFTHAFEKFIIQLENDKDTGRNYVHLLNFLRVKRLDKRFEKKYADFSKKQQQMMYKPTSYFLNQFRADYEFYHVHYDKLNYRFGDFLDKQSKMLDYHFVTEKLGVFFDILNQNKFRDLKSIERISFFPQIVSFIEENMKEIALHHPLLNYRYNSIFLLATLDKKYYYRFRKIIKDRGGKMEKEELRRSLQILFAYFVHLNIRLNSLNINHVRNAVKIYKKMHENHLLSDTYILTKKEFEIVVGFCLILKDHKWCEIFIETYGNHIYGEYGNDAYLIGKANLYLRYKRYDEIFSMLDKLSYKNPDSYVNSKIILSKIYYENNDLPRIRYILDSLRKYKKTSLEISVEMKLRIRLFYKYINLLLKIKRLESRERKTAIKQTMGGLDKDKDLFLKHWFMEKLNEF